MACRLLIVFALALGVRPLVQRRLQVALQLQSTEKPSHGTDIRQPGNADPARVPLIMPVRSPGEGKSRRTGRVRDRLRTAAGMALAAAGAAVADQLSATWVSLDALLVMALLAGVAVIGPHRPSAAGFALLGLAAGSLSLGRPPSLPVAAMLGGVCVLMSLAATAGRRRVRRLAKQRDTALQRCEEMAAEVDHSRATAESAAAALRVASALAGQQDPEGLPDRIASLARQELHGELALLLRPEGKERFLVVGQSGFSRAGELLAMDIPLAGLPGGIVPREPSTMAVERFGSPVLARLWRSAGCASALVLPCGEPGTTAPPVLLVGRPASAGPLSPRDREVAAHLARHAGASLSLCAAVSELTAANRLKEEFLATFSHELRTPLNIIVGYTDLQLDGAFGELSPEHKDALAKIRSQAEHLLALIGETLDAARIERGLFVVRLREVSPAEVLEHLRAGVPPSWRKPTVALRWNLQPGLARIRTDPDKLGIILRNLVHNALKFTESGEVLVSVTGATGSGTVTFVVRDTGRGIPAEHLSEIFQMFRQVRDDDGMSSGGAGLGLYIAQRLATLLGATLDVSSSPGRGSVFRVHLPVAGPLGPRGPGQPNAGASA